MQRGLTGAAQLILTDNRTDTRHTKITPFDGATGGALVRQCHVRSSTSMSVGALRSLLTARSDGQRDLRSHRLADEGSASKTADPVLLKISIRHTGRESRTNPVLNYREPEAASRGYYFSHFCCVNPYSFGSCSSSTNTDSISIPHTAKETQNISTLSGPTVARLVPGLESMIVIIIPHTPRIGSR